jgi:3-hydroxyacyl-[acyl-carrier-protein] dehydratase
MNATADRASADEGRPEGRATRRFAADHPATRGHFPGDPIIPGAVLLREIVAAILPDADVGAAKFHHKVRPGDTMVISWRAGTRGEIRFSCSVEASGRPAVTGVLRPPPP